MAPVVGAIKGIGAAIFGTSTALGTVYTVGSVARGVLTLGAIASSKSGSSSFSSALTKEQLLSRAQNVRISAQPRMTVYGQVRVGGQIAFMETTGTNNEFLWIVIIHAAHEVEELGEIYINDEVVPFDGSAPSSGNKYENFLWKYDHLGTDDQTADSNLVAASASWTSNDRLRGCAYSVYKLKYDAENHPWQSGIPQISRVVKGKKVYDFRDSSTGWTTNAALIRADYIKSRFGATNADFSLSEIQAAANLCEEQIELNDEVTYEDRYAINGVVYDDQDPRQILQQLNDSDAGYAEEIGGVWVVHSGGYRAPTITITEDDIVSGIEIQTKDTVQDAANRVKGVISNAGDDYATTEFPAVTNATYLSEDGGIEKWLELNLPFTTSGATAQRLAKIAMERSRQQISVSFTARISALRIKGGDTVNLTIARYGWTNKPFEVKGLKFELIDGDGRAPALGVRLTLRETASAVWDWADGEETTLDPAPNSSLPNPFAIEEPTFLTVSSGTASLVLKADGTIISRMRIEWTDPADVFVAYYQVQYCHEDEYALGELATWTQLPDISSPSTATYTAEVTDGEAYYVRVRAVNNYGRRSDWVESLKHVVVGKSELPSEPTSFVAVAGETLVTLDWDNPTDIDFDLIEIYQNTVDSIPSVPKYTTRSSFFTIGNLLVDTEYFFWIKSVDTSGNKSAAVGSVSATTGNSAIIVRITASSFFFRDEGATFDPTEITLAAITNAGSPTYQWEYWNGSVWTELIGETSEVLVVEPGDFGESIRYRILLGGGQTDEITLSKIDATSSAYSVILTNEAHSVSCESDGTPKSGEVGSGSAATTNVMVWKGEDLLTAVASSPGDGEFSVTVPSGLTGLDEDTLYVTNNSSLPSDTNIFSLDIDLEGISSATKIFTVTKSKEGAEGDPGADGADGADGAPGADGATGPGVVFKGNYSGGSVYYYNGTTRDVVLYGGTYYIANNDSKSGSSGWGTPGASGDWTTFDANFKSVATALLLAEDATILKTLVMGDGTSGAGIIRSPGKTGYGSGTGFWLGYDGTTPKLDVGGSSDYLRWNGSSLIVSGSVNMTSGSVTGGSLDIGSGYKRTEINSDGKLIFGGIIIFDSASFSANTTYNSATNALKINANALFDSNIQLGAAGVNGYVSAGGSASFQKGDASTSTTTGTLIVGGGVGITGASYIGGAISAFGGRFQTGVNNSHDFGEHNVRIFSDAALTTQTFRIQASNGSVWINGTQCLTGQGADVGASPTTDQLRDFLRSIKLMA